MSDLAHEAEACRRLWVAVAAAAIHDAAAFVARNRDKLGLDEAVKRQARYFRRRDWREVCEYAGISLRPDHIEAMLRSDKISVSITAMRRAYGLMEPKRRDAA